MNAKHPKRRLRNYVLDAPLQLKYVGWMAGMAGIIAIITGVFVWRSQAALAREAELAVEARSRAAEASREVGAAVLSRELLVRFEDPVFVEELESESRRIDARYDQERADILLQKASLQLRQRVAMVTLIIALLGLVLSGAVMMIVLTHRIVGPVFRLKRMIREVGEGKLTPPTYGLRPGDELRDLFELFSGMIVSLRERENLTAERLKRVSEALERGNLTPEARAELAAVRAEVESRLQ
jgi:nitrogen fixation/metabolism regulation signal transduction histidine kinase